MSQEVPAPPELCAIEAVVEEERDRAEARDSPEHSEDVEGWAEDRVDQWQHEEEQDHLDAEQEGPQGAEKGGLAPSSILAWSASIEPQASPPGRAFASHEIR